MSTSLPILKTLIFFLISCFLTGPLQAQDLSPSPVEIYGLDPVLHNGKQYSYYPPPGTGGHQYYSSSLYPTGTLWVRGVEFDNQRLNYDVYNQQLILFYKNPDGSGKTLVVSDAWLEAFTLASTRFVTIAGDDSVKRIYQELGNGPLKFLFKWRKEWVLDPSMGAHLYFFTPLSKEQYLLADGKLKPFGSNSTFLKLFGEEPRNQIKKYLRQHNIRVKKASETKMASLIDYINSINTR